MITNNGNGNGNGAKFFASALRAFGLAAFGEGDSTPERRSQSNRRPTGTRPPSNCCTAKRGGVPPLRRGGR